MKDTNLISLVALCLVVGFISVSCKLRCKFPAQWQSTVFMDFGLMFTVPTQARASGTYYYDYTNNQTRLDLKGMDLTLNAFYDRSLLWRFNEPYFYYVIDHANNSCERLIRQSDFWRQWEGIPESASLTSVGKVGGSQERFEEYQFLKVMVEDDDTIVEATIDVKPGDICAPSRLLMERHGIDPLGTYSLNYEFLDPMDIKNPKMVFKDPTNCTNVTISSEDQRESPFHRRFWPFIG